MPTKAQAKIPPAFAVKAAMAVQAGLSGAARKMAPPFVHVLELITGNWKTQVVYAATKLELMDRLKEGPRTADDLAKQTGQNADALFRLMRALAMLDLLDECSPRTFRATRFGETLQKDHPQSVRHCALLAAAAPSWTEPWKNLLFSIGSGKPAMPHVLGKEIFPYLQANPEEWATFNAWMTQIGGLNCPVVAGSFPFGRFKHVVDVGGGQGMLLAQILLRHESLRGTLYDLPDVVKNSVALDVLEGDQRKRVEVVGGDFFEKVPEGADLYVMQQIIHDWDDERAGKILSNCRHSMAHDGRVLIVDAVIQPGNGPDMNKFLDLQMLLLTGGRERTEPEFKALLERSGLALVKIHPTAAMHCIIEARAA